MAVPGGEQEHKQSNMRILIIEDDEKLSRFIAKGLREEQYAVDVSHDGEDGSHWAMENEYDLVILDIMLPKMDGLSMCRLLREKGINTPIIMLTARDNVEDRVNGLNAGADDYLTKPFSFEELLARVRALLRRSNTYKDEILKVSDLELNPTTRKVMRGGTEINLTGKEYALLEYFMRNEGKIVTETSIIEHVWDMNFESMTNTVNVYIHHLRSKIDRDFGEKLIHTIRGRGFIFKE